MDNTEQMKKLMEAVEKIDVPKVDNPKTDYKNQPTEQTLDSETMSDVGNDLHKKKNWQFRSKDGDNPMAMTPVKVKQVQESLAKKFKAFKKDNK